jgi:hypothetical protein
MTPEFESAGALVTATLAASEIERETAHADKPAHGSCANCQTPLTGSFCHNCGQRAHVHRSLLHLGEELLHGLLHFDAKAWRTLPLLVARPGKLTREYVHGKRTRFVSPLALFLFMVFFMFFFVSSVSHNMIEGVSDPLGEATANIEKAVANSKEALVKAEARAAAARAKGKDANEAQSDVEAARADLQDHQEGLRVVASGAAKVAEATGAANAKPGSTDTFNVNTGMPAVDKAIKHAVKNPELTLYKLKNAASKYSFLLVPISLPFLWLMFFWKRGVTMYDHAVFVLYSLSFMALLVVAMSLLNLAGLKPLVVALVFIGPPIHMFVQLRGAYLLSFGSALWRAIVLICVSATVFLTYLLLILMLSMA